MEVRRGRLFAVLLVGFVLASVVLGVIVITRLLDDNEGSRGAASPPAVPTSDGGDIAPPPDINVPPAEDRQGVTGSEILVGAVSPISGVLPFPGGTMMPADYLKMLNDRGGVNGRKFRYITYTDNTTDVAEGVTACRRLNEQDKFFASVGGAQITSARECWPYYQEHGVPVIGDWSAHTANYQTPVAFAPGVHPGAACKDGLDYTMRTEYKVKKWAFFSENSSPSIDCKQGEETAVRHNGGENVFQSFQPLGYADYTGEVVRAHQAGAEALACSCDPATAARILAAAARQGWKPPMVANHHAFGKVLSDTLGKDSDVIRFSNQGQPGFNETDNPLMAQMQQAIAKYDGNRTPPDGSFVPGWVGARLFHVALEAIGRDVSRTRLMGWLAAQDRLDIIGGVPLDFRPQTALPNWYRIPNRTANVTQMSDGREIRRSGYFPGIDGNNPDPLAWDK
jgi:branched-chain amino acid transport system substrate-binding protein